jgi:hypothetical protein
MKLPTWDEFNQQVASFEGLSKIKDDALQDYDDLSRSSHSVSLKIFPEPFYSVVLDLYKSSDEPPRNKSIKVREYLKQITARGKESYENASKELNSALDDLGYSSFNINIESDRNWIKRIHEIMIAKDSSDISSRVTVLKQEIGNTIDRDRKAINIADRGPEVIGTLRRVQETFELSYNLLKALETDKSKTDVQNQNLERDLPGPEQTLQPEIQKDRINLKIGNTIIETIEKNNLAKLSIADRDALSTYEKNLLTYQGRFLNIKKEIPSTVDADTRFQYESKIKKINENMCAELEQINKILEGIGINPSQLFRLFVSITSLCEGKVV